MGANTRILRRLLTEIDRFESGSLGDDSFAELQSAILGHGHAIDGASREWHDLVDHVEGNVDMTRFTVAADDQLAAVRPYLDRLRVAANDMLRREPPSDA